jgi:hypothetical protein
MLNVYVEDDNVVKVGPISELRLEGQSLRSPGQSKRCIAAVTGW